MEKDQESNTGKESDFGNLVYEVLAGHKPIGELLACPEFTRRLLRTCRALTYNVADAEDLFNDVCLKLIRILLISFQPDFTSESLGFVSWLQKVTANCLWDQKRKQKFTIDAKPVEEHSIIDTSFDVGEKILHDERLAELVKCIKKQPREEVRLAAEFYVLMGYSAPKTVEELSKLGIEVTPPTVRNWVRDALTPFFPNAIAHSISELARKENTPARGKARQQSTPKANSAELEDQTLAKVQLEAETPESGPKTAAPGLVRKENRRSKQRSEAEAQERVSDVVKEGPIRS